MSAAAGPVLVAGYALAVPFSVYVPGFLRLWRRREPLVVVAEELGVALICLGWTLRGDRTAVAINATWGVGLAAALALTRKRKH